MTYIICTVFVCGENQKDFFAEYLCVCFSLGKRLTQCEQKIRKIHSEKKAVIGLGLCPKCPIVLVTWEKVLGTNWGFERGFCICSVHVSVTVSEQLIINLLSIELPSICLCCLCDGNMLTLADICMLIRILKCYCMLVLHFPNQAKVRRG